MKEAKEEEEEEKNRRLEFLFSTQPLDVSFTVFGPDLRAELESLLIVSTPAHTQIRGGDRSSAVAITPNSGPNDQAQRDRDVSKSRHTAKEKTVV